MVQASSRPSRLFVNGYVIFVFDVVPHSRRLWRRWNFVVMTHGKMTVPTGISVVIAAARWSKIAILTSDLSPAQSQQQWGSA